MPVLNHKSVTSTSMEEMDSRRAVMKGKKTKRVVKKKHLMAENLEEARSAWLEGVSGSSEDEESGEVMVVEGPFRRGREAR